MPLLRNGHWVADNPWARLEDDTPLPAHAAADRPKLVSLTRFLDLQSHTNATVSGVFLTPEDDVQLLVEHLHRIQLIIIDFPKYTDSRAYSQARMLREQFHFSGELRASGDIRSDQLLFMARAGINAYEFSEAPDENLIRQILSRSKVNYQPSYSLPVAG